MDQPNNNQRETQTLQERIAQLESLVADLHAQLAARAYSVVEPSGGGTQQEGTLVVATAEGTPKQPTTRRNLMRAVGAASAGIVAGSLVKPSAAAAADPDDVVKNITNTTNDETEIRLSADAPSGRSVFLAQSTAYSSSSRTAAVSGFGGARNVYNGLYGYTEGRSESTATGHGVIAYGGSGSRSSMWLVPFGGSPTSGTLNHGAGEVRVDSGGTLWFCTSSGSPGTWRRLASNASAGAFHLLQTPQRAYDSRIAFGGDGPVAGGASRAVDLDVFGTPSGFTGALTNLTIVSPSAGGFAVLYADGQPAPSTSSVNFGAGQIVGNSVTTAVSPTGFARFAPSVTTEFVVDVVGYYI